MFPTFISILDIQSWWEVPSIAHFCSLFRSAFNLLDFDIEDLEEALLTDGTEDTSWLQELIVRLLSGCLPNNEISTFNYQMFLRRLFRQKCQEHDRYNPFNTDIDFTLLPLRTKVEILHALCDFRLDAEDVLDQLKNLEADSLRVEPLGYDSNNSAYWYFYGTRLYREDFETKNNKKKSVWQVICFTEDDWFQLTKKLRKSLSKAEKQLYHTLSENFLPELPRLFKEKENLARKRLLESQPRRTSSRLKKQEADVEKTQSVEKAVLQQEEEEVVDKKRALEKRRQEAYERRSKLKEQSEESSSEASLDRNEMVRTKEQKSDRSSVNKKEGTTKRQKRNEAVTGSIGSSALKPTTVGRQTNNSLSAAIGGQILIQPVVTHPTKKVKTTKVFHDNDEDLQTCMHKILDFVKDHEDAWPFVDPVEEEYAPDYYSVIKKPMDLQKMEDKLNAGYYKTFAKFRADFQLIVSNCRLYNGAENEYTIMVDGLLKVFEKATEKYLDQIISSDEEAVNVESTKEAKRKNETPPAPTRRKPTLAAQTDKRDRSTSKESLNSSKSGSCESLDNTSVKLKASLKSSKKQKSKSKVSKKNKMALKKELKKEKKNKKGSKEYRKSKERKSKDKKKMDVSKSRSPSRTPSRSKLSSPPLSWSPSSLDTRFDFTPTEDSKKKASKKESVKKSVEKEPFSFLEENENIVPHVNKKQKTNDYSPVDSFTAKPRDKHNTLRETIEKLKAKSEIKLKDEFNFDLDHPKENQDKRKNDGKEEKSKFIKKENSAKMKRSEELQVDSNLTIDHIQPEEKPKRSVDALPVSPTLTKDLPNLEALSMATEQTLKDINKWLDDTPKCSDLTSASNSPSYGGLDDYDILVGNKIDPSQGKKIDKVKKDSTKDKKRPPKDSSKFIKRREVHRTIERLQPGKNKGNLISNVQNSSKTDEMSPLGPLSKIKDTKSNLIVKTDNNAPKLSLGSVLDTFGKHTFIDDQKGKEENEEEKIDVSKIDVIDTQNASNEQVKTNAVEENTESKSSQKKEPTVADAVSVNDSATPNLSAWFRCFGAPKVTYPVKKTDIKPDGKENEKTDDAVNKNADPRKVTVPLISPSADAPLTAHNQPVQRQRRISTGSSMSERSSFSQDMDSPRVGIDERGAYPAPYPSPLHRSPSGASPVMASPRQDISPKPYPAINGQIRVGFYQDTVSNKSSPEKSCSPRDNVQSPYGHYSEHVYVPNTTTDSFHSNANSPHYMHSSTYSSSSLAPTYNLENYYEKPPAHQYQAKSHNYTPNSPAARGQQHSPSPMVVHHSQHSPTITVTSTQSSRSSSDTPHRSSPTLVSPHSSPAPAGRQERSPDVQAQQQPEEGLVTNAPAVQEEGQRQAHVRHSPGVRSQQSDSSNDVEPFGQEQDKQERMAAMEVQKRVYTDREMTGHQYETPLHPDDQKHGKKYPQTAFDESLPMRMDSPSKAHTQAQVVQEKPADIKNDVPPVSSQYLSPYSTDSNYPLNVPNARGMAAQQSNIDLSKYTNMGYTGPEIDYTRSLQQFMQQTQTTCSSSISQTSTSVASTILSTQNVTGAADMTKYRNQLQQSTNDRASMGGYTGNGDRMQMADRYKTDSPKVESSGNLPSRSMSGMEQSLVALGGRELSHIVDRLSGDERLMAGLQTAISHYADKGLGATEGHMFNKPIACTSASLFNQSGLVGMQSYGQRAQNTATTMYNRQMAELIQQQQGQSEQHKAMHMQEKRSKKKKGVKSAHGVPPSDQQQLSSPAASAHHLQQQQQGFQSYAGLKNSTGNSSVLDPGTMALKASTVVPGSAFNFSHTTGGLAGLYAAAAASSDKDVYPNFLEELSRAAAPTYYMAAAAQAAQRHRSTPENMAPVSADKQPAPVNRSAASSGVGACQVSDTQPTSAGAASFPAFLGGPPAHHRQARPPAYPSAIGGPSAAYLANAQAAQLMDTSSPLYQQYIQAGLLNQGLLGPHGAYPPGYHPALSLRQPYDSMTRPPWL